MTPPESSQDLFDSRFQVYYSMRACVLSCVQVFVTPRAVALQAPLSMGFSRQEYLSGLPFLTPGDLPDPGIEPTSLVSPALAGGFFTTSATWEAHSPPRPVPTVRDSGNGTRQSVVTCFRGDGYTLCFI